MGRGVKGDTCAASPLTPGLAGLPPPHQPPEHILKVNTAPANGPTPASPWQHPTPTPLIYAWSYS